MANLKKFNRAALSEMLGHYDRTKPSDKLIHNPELTKYNYNLCENKGSQLDIINSVIGHKGKEKGWARYQNRADVKAMCTWCITMPADLDKSKQKQFFEECYKFLKERYGVNDGKNIVSAYVHVDEVSPHMHFAFVPVVTDKKKGILRVSAKSRIAKGELKAFHPELQKHLEQALGCPVNVLNQATKEGNKSVEELRQLTASGQVQAVKEQAEANKKKADELDKREQELAKREGEFSSLSDEIKALQEQKQELEREIEGRVLVARPKGYIVVNEKVEQVKAYLKGLVENKKLLGGSDGTYTISKQAKMFIEMVIDGLEFNTREIARLQKDVESREERNKELVKENKSLSSSLSAFQSIKALVGADVWKQVESMAKQRQEQARQSMSRKPLRSNETYKGRD